MLGAHNNNKLVIYINCERANMEPSVYIRYAQIFLGIPFSFRISQMRCHGLCDSH